MLPNGARSPASERPRDRKDAPDCSVAHRHQTSDRPVCSRSSCSRSRRRCAFTGRRTGCDRGQLLSDVPTARHCCPGRRRNAGSCRTFPTQQATFPSASGTPESQRSAPPRAVRDATTGAPLTGQRTCATVGIGNHRLVCEPHPASPLRIQFVFIHGSRRHGFTPNSTGDSWFFAGAYRAPVPISTPHASPHCSIRRWNPGPVPGTSGDAPQRAREPVCGEERGVR